jgi:exodeoxyribonuclease VII small subunit
MSEEKTYSEAMQRLEEIVASLERGGKGLDETLQLYEEGAKLLKQCQEELKSAEGKLNELRLEDIEQETSQD